MEQAKLYSPTGYQPQQQQQQQSQQQQGQTTGGLNLQPGSFLTPSSLEGYDMSSLDQLQQHALQLSASAGLTNLLMPNQVPQNTNGHQQQSQQQQQQNCPQQQQFLFLQPNSQQGYQQTQSNQGNNNNSSNNISQFLSGQFYNQNSDSSNNNNNNSNTTNNGQQQQPQQQNFFQGGQNGFNPSQLPANLQQMFAAASGAPGGFNLNPTTFQPQQTQQQSYSNSGIPIPMQMLFPQQQQSQQQPQQQEQQQPQQQPQQTQLQPLQPLQPAPPQTSSKGGGVTGTKRAHDSSVVSNSTLSSESVSKPSVSSISSITNSNSNPISDNSQDYPEFQLRNKDGSVITEKDLEKMTPAERRRYERNLREQQRSFRISQQIQQLRDVLSESKVPFKPNKYSILVSVADYIKQLQTRAIMLDSEHKKLFKTIQETNEMVQSGQIPDPNTSSSSVGGDNNNMNGDKQGFMGVNSNNNNVNQEGEMLFVQGLDYKSVFEQAPTANGVASIDGRILACNAELESILDCTREEIERQSLFTLVQNHQEIFEAMAELLKRADALSNGSLQADPVQLLYWSGRITTPDEKKLGMNITLACTNDGSPKFFSFCMSPESSA